MAPYFSEFEIRLIVVDIAWGRFNSAALNYIMSNFNACCTKIAACSATVRIPYRDQKPTPCLTNLTLTGHIAYTSDFPFAHARTMYLIFLPYLSHMQQVLYAHVSSPLTLTKNVTEEVGSTNRASPEQFFVSTASLKHVDTVLSCRC